MSESGEVRVSVSTRRLIQLGATMEECSMGAFVDKAVTEFLARHADEIEAGLTCARELLLVRAASGKEETQ